MAVCPMLEVTQLSLHDQREREREKESAKTIWRASASENFLFTLNCSESTFIYAESQNTSDVNDTLGERHAKDEVWWKQ